MSKILGGNMKLFMSVLLFIMLSLTCFVVAYADGGVCPYAAVAGTAQGVTGIATSCTGNSVTATTAVTATTFSPPVFTLGVDTPTASGFIKMTSTNVVYLTTGTSNCYQYLQISK